MFGHKADAVVTLCVLGADDVPAKGVAPANHGDRLLVQRGVDDDLAKREVHRTLEEAGYERSTDSWATRTRRSAASRPEVWAQLLESCRKRSDPVLAIPTLHRNPAVGRTLLPLRFT